MSSVSIPHFTGFLKNSVITPEDTQNLENKLPAGFSLEYEFFSEHGDEIYDPIRIRYGDENTEIITCGIDYVDDDTREELKLLPDHYIMSKLNAENTQKMNRLLDLVSNIINETYSLEVGRYLERERILKAEKDKQILEYNQELSMMLKGF